MTIQEYIKKVPKAELHIHIEGSLQAELMFALAQRNNIRLPYNNIEALKAAYNFSNLQDFLDIYYAGAGVLIHEQDFYDLTWAYLQDAHEQNIVHTEIFFDPQTHTDRGIAFHTVINGIYRAMHDAKTKWGMSSLLIMSFLRHLPESKALEVWEMAQPHLNKIVGVGLDSSEMGFPPSLFQRVFAKAEAAGLKLVAHAGEEGPPDYVQQALELLHVHRIDHGNRSLESPELVAELIDRQMPLTVCPLSNIKLCNVSSMEAHPLLQMLEMGLKASAHSDDPAYFGGNLNANLLALCKAQKVEKQHIYQLMKNAFESSFADEARKQELLQMLENA